MKTTIRALGAAALLLLAVAPPAFAGGRTPGTSTTWTGKGTTSDGNGGRTLGTTLCEPTPGADTGIYLLFVLASTGKITNTPTISFNNVSAGPMTKSNGTKSGQSSYKYVYRSDTPINIGSLVNNVTASWTGSGTPTFTISHGCNDEGEGGDALTVHFVGEYDYNPSSPWVFFGENSGGETSAVLKVCESGSTTNCVSFNYGTTPGITDDLVLSGTGKALDVILTDEWAGAYLYSAAITPSQFDSATPLDSGFSSFTTSTTFSNGGDAWFVSFWD